MQICKIAVGIIIVYLWESVIFMKMRTSVKYSVRKLPPIITGKLNMSLSGALPRAIALVGFIDITVRYLPQKIYCIELVLQMFIIHFNKH